MVIDGILYDFQLKMKYTTDQIQEDILKLNYIGVLLNDKDLTNDEKVSISKKIIKL